MARAGSAAARHRRAPRRSRCPCGVCPWRPTSRSRRKLSKRLTSRLRGRDCGLGGDPVARALDHVADPLRIRAVVADEDALPPFVMRRLPEGVGIGLLEDLDRVEVDRDPERRVRLVAREQEGAAVRCDLDRRLAVAGAEARCRAESARRRRPPRRSAQTRGGWLSSGSAGLRGSVAAGRRGGSAGHSSPNARAMRAAASRPPSPKASARGNRGRAEDQPERHHHDLVGKTHEGQADRGEQGDDRIADDRLRDSRLRRCRCRPDLATIRARKMPTTMIRVPKITLPPSSVTWARKIAIVSPPSCLAASIEAARMIAIIAMLATIRDGAGVGRKDAGRADRVVEAGRRQDRFDDRFQEARRRRRRCRSTAPQRARAGSRRRIWLSIAVAGPEIASIPRTWSAAIATGMMISA